MLLMTSICLPFSFTVFEAGTEILPRQFHHVVAQQNMDQSTSDIGNVTPTTPATTHEHVYTGQRTTAETVILSTVVTIILLFSFFGNLLVVICIRGNRRLRQETGNIFLANLSITDMTNAVIVMTASVHSTVWDRWLLPLVWCNIVCMMNYVLIIVSMLTLCFIALDRYVAVVHALKYQTIVTKGKVLALISYAWFQGLVFGIAPWLRDWVQYDYWELICAIDWDRDSRDTVIYVLAAFTLCFLFPAAVLIVCYYKVRRK